jgi:hypothetical protein
VATILLLIRFKKQKVKLAHKNPAKAKQFSGDIFFHSLSIPCHELPRFAVNPSVFTSC